MLLLTIIIVITTHKYYGGRDHSKGNATNCITEPAPDATSENVQERRQRHFEKKFSKDCDNARKGVKDGTKETSRGKQKDNIQQPERRVQYRSRSSEDTTQIPPPLKSSSQHPGLEPFNLWMNAIASIYRSYSIGVYSSEIDIPILPRSERGRIEINLNVKNLTQEPIHVFWIDYKGNEIKKGLFRPHSLWTQTSWVGHPWVFRNSEGRALVFYVPYRVIPKIMSDDDSESDHVGSQSFAITVSKLETDFRCSINDDVFPLHLTSIPKAVQFSCEQMERENASPGLLLKYLYKIALHPGDKKYRQIRIANKFFWSNIWITGGRGVLHALGFVEMGPYLEMGPNEGSLGGDRIKQLSEAIVTLEELQRNMEDPGKPGVIQPLGAGMDSGRAGWRT